MSTNQRTEAPMELETIDSREYYEFDVHDAEGLWGGMRVRSSSKDEAANEVIEALIAGYVEPNGSLYEDFTVTLL